MACTKIIFICLYMFFDPNSERRIWLLKWAECSSLRYRRRLSSISSHNIIVFWKFFRFLYLKRVLAEKTKWNALRLYFYLYICFLDPNSEMTIWLLKWTDYIPLTYKRILSYILSNNMIVVFKFFRFLYLKMVLPEKKENGLY